MTSNIKLPSGRTVESYRERSPSAVASGSLAQNYNAHKDAAQDVLWLAERLTKCAKALSDATSDTSKEDEGVEERRARIQERRDRLREERKELGIDW